MIPRAWSAVPGDLLARVVLAACGIPGPTRRVTAADGREVLVVEDARLGRYLDLAPTRPFAQTLGRYVLAREAIPDATLRHEFVHVGQWRRLGPLFVPAYIGASLAALAAGGDAYADNVFEARARRAEADAGLPGADDGGPG